MGNDPVGGSSRVAPYAWMLTGCFSFAWMSEFASQLGRLDCDWRIIALARSFLAFSFAFALARLCGARLVFLSSPMLWLRSCAGSLSLLCTFYALTWLRTSEVLTLTNTFPIWVALLSWPILRVRPSLAVWLAAGCGVLGVVLLRKPEFATSPGSQLAMVLALAAAFTSAVAMLGLHRLKDLHPWAIVAHFSGVATVFVLGAWLFGEPPDVSPVRDPRFVLLLVGVGATATLGQLCLTRAFTSGQPARVSVVGLTQILMAMGLDVLFGGPAFEPTTLAGIGLVLAPTAWVMAGRTND
jgi:drug/metabolite transporter (DMT)-like permease